MIKIAKLCDTAVEIVELVRNKDYRSAIASYDRLKARVGRIDEMEDITIATLMIDLEFLVNEHPGSSVHDIERQISALSQQT